MIQIMYKPIQFPTEAHDMKKFPRENLGNCMRVSIVP